MSIRGRQLKQRNKINRNAQCPCKSGLKYKFCHGNKMYTIICQECVTMRFASLVRKEKRMRYSKIWRLLWWLLWPFGIRRPKCPCGSGLRHMYCHGNQKKADECKEVYTQAMKTCIKEAKARKAARMFDKINSGHEYVESKDKQIENSKKGNRLC